MKKLNLLIFCQLLLFSFTGEVYSDNTCDSDWEPYKDEKCLKVFDTAGLVSYEKAESFCKEKYNATLISIGFEAEQKFIENFLKSKETVDNVWIGLKYESDNNYVWSDDTEFHYSNWALGSPKNNPEYCVQMDTDEAEYGKWVDVSCARKNVIVCEKIQPWSLSQLQNEVMNIKKNLVPIGFIYVQIPKEQAPADIWSWMTWEDVTSDYAGVFFRAEGGNSSSFGSVQEDTSPRVIESNVNFGGNQNALANFSIPADGKSHRVSWARYAQTYSDYVYQNLTVSADEVRPRNMAVRIWKRIQ